MKHLNFKAGNWEVIDSQLFVNTATKEELKLDQFVLETSNDTFFNPLEDLPIGNHGEVVLDDLKSFLLCADHLRATLGYPKFDEDDYYNAVGYDNAMARDE